MDLAEAYDRLVRGIPLPKDRTPEAKGDLLLPPGTSIVSADNHWSVTEDIFYERFPAHLKDKAPRLSTSEPGVYNWHINGESILPPHVQRSLGTFECVPGAVRVEPRLDDLDIEGMEQELVFGNAIGAFYAYPDLEVREWVFRIYNEHLAEVGAQSGGRFHGVGLINYWDMDRVRESIDEVKALGLKTYLLPQVPKAADNVPINYCLPEMAPLWEAVEEAGLPICFHIGEFSQDGPGGMGTTLMVNFGPFRKILGQLIFGGIFDRHPSLQVAFVEAEINWVPGALQTATMLYECFPTSLEPQIKHPPRHYWHNNCYAVFTHDPAGLRLLDLVGADRVMWSADYPHQEGTYGFSWSAIQEVLKVATPDQARMILGGTAKKVFNLD